MRSPADASPMLSRACTHGSGPMWIATPSCSGLPPLTPCRSPGALTVILELTTGPAVAFQTRFPDHRRFRGIARLVSRRTFEQDRVAAAISEVEGEADHQPYDEAQPSLPRQEHHQQEREGDAEDRYKRHARCAER